MSMNLLHALLYSRTPGRGVIKQFKWIAFVEASEQVYQSVFDYPTVTEAQAWVERKIETLLSTRRSTP